MRLSLEGVPSDLGRETFGVNQCEACGVGSTIPIPKDISPFYGDYYGDRHGFTAGYRARRRLNRITRSVEGGQLLDIGYGEGTFLDLAAKRGFVCGGTERIRRNEEARFAAFDGLAAVRETYPAHSFSAVTCWHSLEHLTNPGDILDEIRELLAEDGSFFVAVPNFAGRQAELFGRNWLHLDVPRHLIHFTPKGIDRILNKHGFQVAEIWHHESEYDIMGWSQSLLNKITGTRNVFFNTLTGRETSVGPMLKMLHFVAGSIFSLFAIPLVLFDIATKSGGTLVVRATKKIS